MQRTGRPRRTRRQRIQHKQPEPPPDGKQINGAVIMGLLGTFAIMGSAIWFGTLLLASMILT